MRRAEDPGGRLSYSVAPVIRSANEYDQALASAWCCRSLDGPLLSAVRAGLDAVGRGSVSVGMMTESVDALAWGRVMW